MDVLEWKRERCGNTHKGGSWSKNGTGQQSSGKFFFELGRNNRWEGFESEKWGLWGTCSRIPVKESEGDGTQWLKFRFAKKDSKS